MRQIRLLHGWMAASERTRWLERCHHLNLHVIPSAADEPPIIDRRRGLHLYGKAGTILVDIVRDT